MYGTYLGRCMQKTGRKPEKQQTKYGLHVGPPEAREALEIFGWHGNRDNDTSQQIKLSNYSNGD